MENNSYLDILNKNRNLTYLTTNITESFEFFITKINEKYFYISFWAEEIDSDIRYEDESEEVFVINRCFKTREEAEDYYQFLIAAATLKSEIIKINNGWIPNLDDENQLKFFIYSDKSRKVLDYDYTFGIIRKLKEDSIFYLKDKESAKFIINKYQKELKKYFGVPNE